MTAGHIAVAFLKAQQEAVFFALLLQQGNLLADVFKTGEDVDHLDAVAFGNHICQRGGHNGFDSDWIFRHGSLCDALLCNIVEHQHADFVAGRQDVLAVVIDRDAATVRIRIGGPCSRTISMSSMPILPRMRRTSLLPVPLSGV